MNWKKAAADAIQCGAYVIERVSEYVVTHEGKTIAVALDADTAKERCAAHAVGRDVVDEAKEAG